MGLVRTVSSIPRSASPLPKQAMNSGIRSLTPTRFPAGRPQVSRDKRSLSSIRGRMEFGSARTTTKATLTVPAAEGDCFSSLGLSPSATASEIRQAYRTLAKKYHPDANPTEAASSKFVELRSAYEMCLFKESIRTQNLPASSPVKKPRQSTASPARTTARSSPARPTKRSQSRRDAWDDIWDEMLSSPKSSRRQR